MRSGNGMIAQRHAVMPLAHAKHCCCHLQLAKCCWSSASRLLVITAVYRAVKTDLPPPESAQDCSRSSPQGLSSCTPGREFLQPAQRSTIASESLSASPYYVVGADITELVMVLCVYVCTWLGVWVDCRRFHDEERYRCQYFSTPTRRSTNLQRVQCTVLLLLNNATAHRWRRELTRWSKDPAVSMACS